MDCDQELLTDFMGVFPCADIRLVRLSGGDHCQDRGGDQAMDHGISGAGQVVPGVAGRCQIVKQLADF